MHHIEINQFDIYLDKPNGTHCFVNYDTKEVVNFTVLKVDGYEYVHTIDKGKLIPECVVEKLRFVGMIVPTEFDESVN